jgi:hypothetical protein
VTAGDLPDHPFVGLFVAAEAVETAWHQGIPAEPIDGTLEYRDIAKGVFAFEPAGDALDRQLVEHAKRINR